MTLDLSLEKGEWSIGALLISDQILSGKCRTNVGDVHWRDSQREARISGHVMCVKWLTYHG